MDVVEKARALAEKLHQGAIRKYTGKPYIEHPKRVVEFVSEVPHTMEMIAAAWLHDVLEDTSATPELLRAEVGNTVTDLVVELTDVSRPSDGNRQRRKAKDLMHLASVSGAAQTIKLADILDNLPSVIQHDPEFAKRYAQEKREQLAVLSDGNSLLWAKVRAVLWDYYGTQDVAA